MYKFYGSIENLQSIIEKYDIQGTWKSEKSGKGLKHTFRSVHGGIINWWPTKTVQFQGKEPDCSALERALTRYLATKDSIVEIEYRPVGDVLVSPKDDVLAIEHVSRKR